MDQQLTEWRKQFNQEIPERVGLAFYTNDAGEVEIEVYLADESMWMSQQIMAELYGVDIRTINEHLINIFNAEELDSESTIRKIRIVRQEGKRQVNREIQFYNPNVASICKSLTYSLWPPTTTKTARSPTNFLLSSKTNYITPLQEKLLPKSSSIGLIHKKTTWV